MYLSAVWLLHGWCHMKLLLYHPVYTIQPCTKTHYFRQGHICRMNVYLAVTCHLHFWQNDWDLLCATVVTRGLNGYSGFKTTTKIYINFFLFCVHCNLYCSCFLLILLSFFYTQKTYSSAPFMCLVNCIIYDLLDMIKSSTYQSPASQS